MTPGNEYKYIKYCDLLQHVIWQICHCITLIFWGGCPSHLTKSGPLAIHSAQRLSVTVNWSGTTLIAFDIYVTGVIFDRNYVV